MSVIDKKSLIEKRRWRILVTIIRDSRKSRQKVQKIAHRPTLKKSRKHGRNTASNYNVNIFLAAHT